LVPRSTLRAAFSVPCSTPRAAFSVARSVFRAPFWAVLFVVDGLGAICVLPSNCNLVRDAEGAIVGGRKNAREPSAPPSQRGGLGRDAAFRLDVRPLRRPATPSPTPRAASLGARRVTKRTLGSPGQDRRRRRARTSKPRPSSQKRYSTMSGR